VFESNVTIEIPHLGIPNIGICTILCIMLLYKALIAVFITLYCNNFVQLLRLIKEKKNAICCQWWHCQTQHKALFLYKLWITWYYTFLPSQTNHNYTHAFEIATTFVVDLFKRKRLQLIELSSNLSSQTIFCKALFILAHQSKKAWSIVYLNYWKV